MKPPASRWARSERILTAGSSSLERVVFAVRGADARQAFEQALTAT